MDQKLIVLLGLTVLAAATGVYLYSNQTTEVESDYYKTQFTQWKQQYGRKYGTVEEEFRYEVFRANLKAIDEHNTKAEESFEMGLNEFADLTQEEYRAKYLTLKSTPKKKNLFTSFTGFGVELDAEVDWRGKGGVTNVKNQGSCGSCWAFSTTGSVEGRIFVRDGTLPSLSEQELVDCSHEDENQGCNGGLMDSAFKYIIANGLSTEQAYPYKGRAGTCQQGVTPRFTITGFTDVQVESEQALLAAIQQQPVSVAINAGSLQFQFYRSGVFSAKCSNELNHGVLAVGFGEEGGKPYYLVKNSWGQTWGDHGFIKLIRNGDGPGQCGIQDAASFPN